MNLQTQLPATVMGTNVAYCCTLNHLRFRKQVVLVKYYTLWTSESFLVGYHYKYHTSKYNIRYYKSYICHYILRLLLNVFFCLTCITATDLLSL